MKPGKDLLFEKFVKFISEKKLVNPGDKILLAVSGGMDSSVMTNLFSKTKYNFGIAHCNFGLRGKESDGDAVFVSKLAVKLNKPFYQKKFDTEKFAKENNYSIQESARILRYDFFREISKKSAYNKIATAHNLDDSIETFFINLLRGTGTAGLRGIPVQNNSVIRPILFASRKEIEEYSLQNKIKYREDSSNQSDNYLRNRIRHHLLPVLKENAEGFESNMENLMQDFVFIDELVKEKMDQWKVKNLQTDSSGNTLIPIEKIQKEKYSHSFLSHLLYSLGITGLDCMKILSAKSAGKKFIHKEFTILRDRENLIIQKNKAEKIQTRKIKELPIEIRTSNALISIRPEKRKKNDPVSSPKNIQQVDADKITLPMIARPWKAGDFFFPLGMKGKKKISDFYTDQKIDRFQKR